MELKTEQGQIISIVDNNLTLKEKDGKELLSVLISNLKNNGTIELKVPIVGVIIIGIVGLAIGAYSNFIGFVKPSIALDRDVPNEIGSGFWTIAGLAIGLGAFISIPNFMKSNKDFDERLPKDNISMTFLIKSHKEKYTIFGSKETLTNIQNEIKKAKLKI